MTIAVILIVSHAAVFVCGMLFKSPVIEEKNAIIATLVADKEALKARLDSLIHKL